MESLGDGSLEGEYNCGIRFYERGNKTSTAVDKRYQWCSRRGRQGFVAEVDTIADQ
jgi:hypothetical protein